VTHPDPAKRATAARSAPKPGRSARRLRVLAGAAIIVVATCIAYYPSLGGGFILDDNVNLTDSALIKASDGLYRFWLTMEPIDYWPMFNTTLWLEWRLWGLNPTGYHVTNLLLHIAEALLIWAILWKLSIPGAFVAAMLFAVHPVNVESVAWITQRKNTLALLFFLLSILWYLKAETRSPPKPGWSLAPVDRWYVLSLAAFALAMLSKSSVAVLPLLLLLGVAWLRPLTKRDLMRVAPFLLVSVVLILVTLSFQSRTEPTVNTGLVERMLGAGAVVWFYLYKALLPVNLSFFYPKWHIQAGDVRWWLPLLAAVAVTGVLWQRRHSWGRPLLFAWVFFGVSLAPAMGLTNVGFMEYSLVADHYQHIALIGVIAVVGAGWGVWSERAHGSARWIPNAVAVVVAATLTVLCWRQSGLYVDATTLYRATVAQNPGSWIGYNNLGFALLPTNPEEAMQHFEQALRLKFDYFDAHNNLGFALIQAHRPEEARAHIEQALRLKPYIPEANYNMGTVLSQIGQPQEALEYYTLTVRLKPEFTEAHHDLAVVLAQTGHLPEAIQEYRQALSLRPDDAEYHYELATTLVQARQLQEGIRHFQEALRLRPGYPEAHNNLGGVLFETGRPQEAMEHYEQALRLKPDFPETHHNLGKAQFKAGEFDEAIAHFQQAVQLDPTLVAAHNDLGVALAQTGQLEEAIAHFQEALRLKPDDVNAHNNLEETVTMKRKVAEREQ